VSLFGKSEIDETLSRIAMAHADGYGLLIRRRNGPGDGWFLATDLGPDGPAPPVLLANVRGLSEPPPDHIRAEWLLESVARALADLGGSFLVSARRLPDLTPGNVLLAAEGGLVRATGVIGEEMTVVEGDPAAGRPGITDAAGWEELADLFRIGFIDLLAPLIGWLDENGLRPEKTLWHAAADRLAQSLIWSGKAFEDREFAAAVTSRVTGGDDRLRIQLGTGEDEYGERYHLRNTCCLAYRTPEGGLCRACPLHKERN